MPRDKPLLAVFEAAARRPLLGALLAAAVPLALGLSELSAKGPFSPLVHDEYSHALAADTFAHGRLTNPASPDWAHFEAFDVLSRPTRMSRKPPAIGLFLALGQRLFGDPVAGALIAAALAAAAIGWALQGWLPPAWALLGAVLAGLHPELFAWSVSYWGGGIGVLGGALALGGWKRSLDAPEPAASAALGLGLALLANSRPFEGLLFAIPLGASLAWKHLRESGRARREALKAALPLFAVLAATAAAMGVDNLRVTGSALKFPYTVYEEQYNPEPLLIWQHQRPPIRYRNAEFEAYFNGFVPDLVRGQETWGGYAAFAAGKLKDLAALWLKPWPLALAFAAGMLGFAPPAAAALTAIFVLGIVFLSRMPILAHYCSPGCALFFLVVASALRRASQWRWRGLPAGAACVALTVALCASAAVGAWREHPDGAMNPCVRVKDGFKRRAAATLGPDAKQLVFVRVPPGLLTQQGWFYNEADMDAAQVVWARELSRDEDCRLAAASPGRSIWRLTVAPPKADFALLRSADSRPEAGPRAWDECVSPASRPRP